MLSLLVSSDVGFHSKILAVVACATLFLRSSADENTTVVYAVANQTVHLPCPLPLLATTPRIEWSDFVYNTDPRPKRIFSAIGRRRNMEASHPNSANYMVDANFTLSIHNVKVDDAGEYRCSSRQEQHTAHRVYYLAVSGHPLCSGTEQMHPGQTGHYSCESEFSGNYQPNLEWFRGRGDWDSVDNFDVRLAKRVFDLRASESDDGTTFTCRLTFGDVIKECNVNLTVWYPVRDLVIDPIKETFTVDEAIRCSANGSPTPEISFEPDLDPGEIGFGWRSATIPRSLSGRKGVTVECVATNLVDGRVETVKKNISFSVTEKIVVDSGTGGDGGNKGQSTHSKASSSSGAIVGGIVVGIMILVIIVAVVFCVRLRKDKKPTKEENGGAKTQPQTRDETQTTRSKENEV